MNWVFYPKCNSLISYWRYSWSIKLDVVSLEHLTALLTFKCLLISQASTMYPVWDFVVKIYLPKKLSLICNVYSKHSVTTICSSFIIQYNLIYITSRSPWRCQGNKVITYIPLLFFSEVSSFWYFSQQYRSSKSDWNGYLNSSEKIPSTGAFCVVHSFL